MKIKLIRFGRTIVAAVMALLMFAFLYRFFFTLPAIVSLVLVMVVYYKATNWYFTIAAINFPSLLIGLYISWCFFSAYIQFYVASSADSFGARIFLVIGLVLGIWQTVHDVFFRFFIIAPFITPPACFERNIMDVSAGDKTFDYLLAKKDMPDFAPEGNSIKDHKIPFACKNCGCVIKKGTRVCPHCGAYIGPNKVRRTRIFAAVCAVLLCASLAANIGLSLYTKEMVAEVTSVRTSLSGIDIPALMAENEELSHHRETLREDIRSWKNKYFAALKTVDSEVKKRTDLESQLAVYHLNIAFVNEWNQWGQLYHTAGCSLLNQGSYIYTIPQAQQIGCIPCGRCH